MAAARSANLRAGGWLGARSTGVGRHPLAGATEALQQAGQVDVRVDLGKVDTEARGADLDLIQFTVIPT